MVPEAKRLPSRSTVLQFSTYRNVLSAFTPFVHRPANAHHFKLFPLSCTLTQFVTVSLEYFFSHQWPISAFSVLTLFSSPLSLFPCTHLPTLSIFTTSSRLPSPPVPLRFFPFTLHFIISCSPILFTAFLAPPLDLFPLINIFFDGASLRSFPNSTHFFLPLPLPFRASFGPTLHPPATLQFFCHPDQRPHPKAGKLSGMSVFSHILTIAVCFSPSLLSCNVSLPMTGSSFHILPATLRLFASTLSPPNILSHLV